MSDSLRPHGLQHTKLLYLPLSPGVCSNPYLWSLWCNLTISSSVSPMSFCPQSFPVSESFPKNWPFASGGQSIGASASASVLPMNIQSWFPLGLTGLISLKSEGLSRVFSSSKVWKHQFFETQTSLRSSFHIHTWLLDKPWLDGKVMSLLFNVLPRFVIVFLSRSKHLLIS